MKAHVEYLWDEACVPQYICRAHAKISFWFTLIPSPKPFPLLSSKPMYVLLDLSQILWPEDPFSCFGLYFIQKPFNKYLLNECMLVTFNLTEYQYYPALLCICFKHPKRQQLPDGKGHVFIYIHIKIKVPPLLNIFNTLQS